MKTLKASEFIKLLQNEMKQFGDLPLYITADPGGGGEFPVGTSSVRFAPRVAIRKSRNNTETITENGRFFVLSDL